MAAHNAGFNAVECHWPYDCDPQQLKAVLDQTGLPMLGLNTRRGDLSAGENGLLLYLDARKKLRLILMRRLPMPVLLVVPIFMLWQFY